MNEILNAFAAEGLSPGSVQCDGKIHRFSANATDKKKSAWYVGHRNFTQSGGEDFYVVVFGNYREGTTFTYQSNVQYSAQDRKVMRDQMEKAKRSAEAQRAAHQEEVSKELTAAWDRLKKEGESVYLARKQLLPDDVGGVYSVSDLGVSFDQDGALVIPLRDENGKLWSLQKIRGDGSKQFAPGGRIQGCFHIIGKDRLVDGFSSRLFIVEGFATAASVFASQNGKSPVIVAFQSSNLERVARVTRKVFPNSEIIVCGDDDLWTFRPDGTPFNPGREGAEAAAKISLGTALFPIFKNPEKGKTDFNDLHVTEGLEAVTRILNIKEGPKLALYALGFSDDTYFFSSSSNRQIAQVTTFKEDSLLKLMPLGYWQAVYPGNGDAQRVDWTLAKSELMEQCRSRGIFSSSRVRGAGVWDDDGRIVVNMGDHLLVNGERVELGKIKSRFFYTLSRRLQSLHERPLEAEECGDLIDACTGFKWTKGNESGMLLAGILVLSRVCGALPVRPHAWITGGAQTGKTTLLEKLIKPVLGDSSLYVQGSTSEAGLRQSLKANALPVLFDEFETTGQKSFENIASCLELMRASWAKSGAMIIKGSGGGNAVEYQVSFSAIVSSIRTMLTNDADKGRFAVLELAPHGSDPEHWKELSLSISKINAEYSERLFARTIKMMPVLIENYKAIKAAFAQKANSRFGDQYGMILAGFSILLQDEPIGVENAIWLTDQMKLEEERDNTKQADHDDALDHLLSKSLRYEGNGSTKEELIGNLISSVSKTSDHYEKKALSNIGIKVDKEWVSIIYSSSSLAERVWNHTRWAASWKDSLGRLDGTERNAQIWINGKNGKGIRIPMRCIFPE